MGLLDRGTDGSAVLSSRTLSDQQAMRLGHQHHGDDAEGAPMATVPTPSQTGFPVSTVSPTPPSQYQTDQRPVSSSSTTGSSGLRDRRMNCHQVLAP